MTSKVIVGSFCEQVVLSSQLVIVRISHVTWIVVCQSVIFGSLTLRKTRTLNFGVKFDFSKIRMEPVMHDSLAITENRKREIRTIE